MEFDELKGIWVKTNQFQQKDENELRLILQRKSQSIISKLKRSVWMELILTIVAGSALLFYALMLPNGSAKWICISIVALFVLYPFYYIKKLMLLTHYHRHHDSLKDNLKELISQLHSYLKFYKKSYAVLYPLYFCMAMFFVAIEHGAKQFFVILSKPQTLLYISLMALLFFLCYSWFINWFLKRLYGSHLERLKALLEDLDS